MTNINCYFDSGIMPHSVIEKSVILERSLINRIFGVREAIWLKERRLSNIERRLDLTIPCIFLFRCDLPHLQQEHFPYRMHDYCRSFLY